MQQAFIFILLISFALSFVPAPFSQLVFDKQKVKEIQLNRLSDSDLEAHWKISNAKVYAESEVATVEMYGFPFTVQFKNFNSCMGPYCSHYLDVILTSGEYIKKKIVLDCGVAYSSAPSIIGLHQEFEMIEKGGKSLHLGTALTMDDVEMKVSCKIKITH